MNQAARLSVLRVKRNKSAPASPRHSPSHSPSKRSASQGTKRLRKGRPTASAMPVFEKLALTPLTVPSSSISTQACADFRACASPGTSSGHCPSCDTTSEIGRKRQGCRPALESSVTPRHRKLPGPRQPRRGSAPEWEPRPPNPARLPKAHLGPEAIVSKRDGIGATRQDSRPCPLANLKDPISSQHGRERTTARVHGRT